MRGIDVAPDASLAARLQRDAESNPAGYRARLVALALFGDVTLTLAQVLPIAAPIIVGVMWVNHPMFYVAGAMAILLVAWIVRPQWRITGRAVTAQEAPELFAALDALRAKLDVPTRMDVVVDEEFNAGAGETPGFLGFGKKAVLVLGMPLLVTLTREQLLAIVAHEFGHFSRRHGRFGHWLYRARAGWLDYVRHVDESSSPLERFAAVFAHSFVPYFSVRSFIHSRMCEYEADRDAALAVGAPAAADALSRLSVVARIWYDGIPRELIRLQERSPEPPQDLYGHFAAAVAAWTAEGQRKWLEDALAEPSGWADTHPGLADRLGSIRAPASLPGPPNPDESAGAQLFGAAWPTLLEELNTKWLSRLRPEWLLLHLRLKHIARPLVEREARADAQDRLARARALRWLEPARGLAALRELDREFPEMPEVRFALGAALLNENDESGVALLVALAKTHPAFRMPAHIRLADYFNRRRDKDSAEHWLEHLNLSARRRADAVAAFWNNVSRGDARPTSLDPSGLTVLKAALGHDKRVVRAWLMEGTVPLATAENPSAAELVVHGLVLKIDTEEKMRSGNYEDEIAAHYEWALSTLVPPHHHATVSTYLTTEPERSYEDRFRLDFERLA